jgi:hypothetical protein
MEDEPKCEALSIVLRYWLGHVGSWVSRTSTITFTSSASAGDQVALLAWVPYVHFATSVSSSLGCICFARLSNTKVFIDT